MPLQTITTQIDIPEGWEFVRVGAVSQDEYYLSNFGNPTRCEADYKHGFIVIRRAKKYRTPTLPDDLGKQCEFSNNEKFDCPCVGELSGMYVRPDGLFSWRCGSLDSAAMYFRFCRIEVKDNEQC